MNLNETPKGALFMIRRFYQLTLGLVLCAALQAGLALPAHADSSEAKFASGAGNVIYLAAGTLLPLVEDGKDGEQHAVRTADSVLTSTIITEVLKHVVREKRPRSSERTSFPSGHATAAFAVATMESHYHPRQAGLWYGGATLIAASRVQLHAHYVHDVIAGAAVGYFTSRFELSRPRGLLLAPFIKADSGSQRMTGLQVTKIF